MNVLKIFFGISGQEEFSVLKISPNKNSDKNPNIADHFFSTLHGIYEERTWWEAFLGKKQYSLSFEIVQHHQKIFFYVRVPKHLARFLAGQLYAHYPECEVEEVPEYLPKEKNISISSAQIELENSSLWPLKRYTQFEDKIARTVHDPLSGLLLPLSDSLEENEQLGITISIRPFDDEKFRNRATSLLQIVSLRRQRFAYLQKKFEKNFLVFGFWKRIFALPSTLFFSVFSGKAVPQKISSPLQEQESAVEVETSGSHERETDISAASDKISRLVFETSITAFYVSSKPRGIKIQKLKEIFSPFKQFTTPYLNGFVIENFVHISKKIYTNIQSCFVGTQQNILNTEELATIWHLPNNTVSIPQIDWVQSKKISAPQNLPTDQEKDTTTIGITNFRGKKSAFGIRPDDRRRHIYIAGKTGMGKSTLLENMIFSDISQGRGVAVVDPHGDLAEATLQFLPKNRTNDVILFDPADREFPISFNILECPNQENRHLVASGVVGVFKKMFGESWGPRLEHILRNTLLALIEAEGQSLLGVLRMLADKKYRDEILKKVHDPTVSSFWKDEFGAWQEKQRTEAVAPIQNKVGQFLSSSLIRNILGQTKSSFDMRHAMDTGKIIIVNLSKGKIGEDNSALLGAMMITKFQLDVMSRADISETKRKDFYLYVDEFQNFATSSFATILSEARKYKLNLTVANQYLAQMDEEVRDAIFGNVGSLITFQMGFDDAEKISQQFGGEEQILPADIGGLPKYQTYLRLMIDGMPSPVFSSNTLPPPDFSIDITRVKNIQKVSREKYAKPRQKVEDQIMKWAKK